MSQFIEIHWTTASMDEARKICRFLVQERHVACAQITPWIESIFMWNNKIDTVQETKVVFKARLENFDTIKDTIIKNTSYEVPEITYRNLDGGYQGYFDWMEESMPTKGESPNASTQ